MTSKVSDREHGRKAKINAERSVRMRRKMRCAGPAKRWALRAYREGQMPLREISSKAHVSISTISRWAEIAGIPRRRRGRRKLEKPTKLHERILYALTMSSYGAVAQEFGMSKARVWAIAKRWARVDEIRLARRAETSAAPTNIAETSVVLGAMGFGNGNCSPPEVHLRYISI